MQELDIKDNPTHSGLILRSQLMADLNIKDLRKIAKMIAMGDLPKLSFGGPRDEVVGWHKDVLSRFYLERYQRQQALR